MASNTSFGPIMIRTVATAASLMLLITLGACGKTEERQTVGQQLDSVVAKTEQAAVEAKARTEASMAKAGEALKVETQKAQVAGKKTAEAVAASVEDMAITASVSAALAKDADLSAIKINVDTKNGRVTLSGPAPTADARDKASNIAKGVKGVSSVDNQLMVRTS